MESQLYLGKNPLRANRDSRSADTSYAEGEDFYQIANYDRMRPFFMTIVSDADHWMFISSNGGLTAGRRNADLALFPYYTDDKIHDSAEVTGSKTVLIVQKRAGAIFGNRFRSAPGHLSAPPQPLQEFLGQQTDL